ncbi:cell division protein FtsQ [Sediminibacterium ginsengisoli]|uniref:Cell division protein FtsQ n=2 Tax=Sediminibacterium ginsengisoli TaxID=413434 RepID=A0A1T4N0N5_9BACT|nr:cell division protein FtsQ [Sediminibacterium ginsengisoli]
MKKMSWKKRVLQVIWLLAGIGTIVLLGAAMQKKSQRKCEDVQIEIAGAEHHMFIDEKDVLQLVNARGPVKGLPVSAVNLRQLETGMEKNPWVKNAELYFDNGQVLQVKIEEREPVARVFTAQGSSFYLDSGGLRLPLSEKMSARVPVFTGFPSDKAKLSKPDSALLEDVVKLSRYIVADSFWMAHVSQVDITPHATFELIPAIGDHIVALGDAEEIDSKFSRLYTFYKKAWLQQGMNKYEKVDVQYANQVVAVKRGTAKKLVDSAAAAKAIESLLKGTAVADSSTVVVAAPPAKDSAVVKKMAAPVVKQPVKEKTISKTNAPLNNKQNNKTLSKQQSVKSGKKTKPAAKTNKPKAVMQKK